MIKADVDQTGRLANVSEELRGERARHHWQPRRIVGRRDDTSIALRNEVETLQGQVERLTAEVRLGSALKNPFS
jgi:hypothetical protein